jgi:hypothetical protein
VKTNLQALGYIALIVLGVFVAAHFFSGQESAFQETDPSGYAEWKEEAREEGKPDPRG